MIKKSDLQIKYEMENISVHTPSQRVQKLRNLHTQFLEYMQNCDVKQMSFFQYHVAPS